VLNDNIDVKYSLISKTICNSPLTEDGTPSQSQPLFPMTNDPPALAFFSENLRNQALQLSSVFGFQCQGRCVYHSSGISKELCWFPYIADHVKMWHCGTWFRVRVCKTIVKTSFQVAKSLLVLLGEPKERDLGPNSDYLPRPVRFRCWLNDLKRAYTHWVPWLCVLTHTLWCENGN
jgi:hypothetical protein